MVGICMLSSDPTALTPVGLASRKGCRLINIALGLSRIFSGNKDEGPGCLRIIDAHVDIEG